MSTSFTTKVNLTQAPEPKIPGIFVDLLVDGNFKLILAKPANKHILIPLLNELLPKKIADLKLVMQEKQGRRADLKNSIFDLDCELDDGSSAVVEVQYNSREDYLDRMLYYSTWPISEQKHVSENNYRLKEVYIISFCNFALRHDEDWEEDKVLSSYTLREDSNGEKMTEALHFVYVELGRFRKEKSELNDQLENFLYYLKNMRLLDKLPDDTGYKPVNDLVRVAEVESLCPDDRNLYDRNMRNSFDIRTEKIYAREEGKAESRKEIAKNMLDDKVNIAVISKYTGLSEAEIKAL